jgi:hypothetical protein
METVASCVICSKSGISQDLIVNGVVKSSIKETSFVLIDIANVLEKKGIDKLLKSLVFKILRTRNKFLRSFDCR